jgi:hypothetical protein
MDFQEYKEQFDTLKAAYQVSDADLDIWDQIKDLHLELSATYGEYYEQASTTQTKIAKKEALKQAEQFSQLAEEIHNFLHSKN